jgi:serine/threonine protein kinase
MEYLEAGSIADLMKESGPLDEQSVAYVLSELLLALEYLHSERKIHRDVKVGITFHLSVFLIFVQFLNSIFLCCVR